MRVWPPESRPWGSGNAPPKPNLVPAHNGHYALAHRECSPRFPQAVVGVHEVTNWLARPCPYRRSEPAEEEELDAGDEPKQTDRQQDQPAYKFRRHRPGDTRRPSCSGNTGVPTASTSDVPTPQTSTHPSSPENNPTSQTRRGRFRGRSPRSPLKRLLGRSCEVSTRNGLTSSPTRRPQCSIVSRGWRRGSRTVGWTIASPRSASAAEEPAGAETYLASRSRAVVCTALAVRLSHDPAAPDSEWRTYSEYVAWCQLVIITASLSARPAPGAVWHCDVAARDRNGVRRARAAH